MTHFEFNRAYYNRTVVDFSRYPNFKTQRNVRRPLLPLVRAAFSESCAFEPLESCAPPLHIRTKVYRADVRSTAIVMNLGEAETGEGKLKYIIIITIIIMIKYHNRIIVYPTCPVRECTRPPLNIAQQRQQHSTFVS